jgi:hypothetical protein
MLIQPSMISSSCDYCCSAMQIGVNAILPDVLPGSITSLRNCSSLKCIHRCVCGGTPSPDLGLSVVFFKFLSEVIPQNFPSRLRSFLCKYSNYCVYFISKCSYCRYLSTGTSFRQLSFSMRISKSAIVCINQRHNLCHMDRSTGTTYAIYNTRNISRYCERLQHSLEFFKLRWKHRW